MRCGAVVRNDEGDSTARLKGRTGGPALVFFWPRKEGEEGEERGVTTGTKKSTLPVSLCLLVHEAKRAERKPCVR